MTGELLAEWKDVLLELGKLLEETPITLHDEVVRRVLVDSSNPEWQEGSRVNTGWIRRER